MAETPEMDPKDFVDENGKPIEIPSSFTHLLFELSLSCRMALGYTDPQNMMALFSDKINLAMAKHYIDYLQMLTEKTKGNLDDEENKFLTSMVTEFHLEFVKATNLVEQNKRVTKG